MDVAVDPDSTSALNQLRFASSDKGKIRGQIPSIDAICEHHGIERIDFLKTSPFHLTTVAAARDCLRLRGAVGNSHKSQ
jgi:hypothetical protein